jgi:hypothetical protein
MRSGGFFTYTLAGALAMSLVALAGASTALHGGDSASDPKHISRKSVDNTHYCDGCTPPLVYNGGPVVDTSGPRGFTVVPVFWAPQGYTFPPNYVKAVSGYIKNVAAASGQTGNVVSIASEYFQKTTAGKVNLRYRITAAQPILDDNPYPAGGCKVVSADYTACVTDAQLRLELAQGITQTGLPTGLSVFYPVFFPPGVMTQDRDGSNSDSTYCGYHRSFGAGANTVLYGNEPFEVSGCGGGQAPSGSPVTDATISTLSHELLETMTDPADDPAWVDARGNEIADICATYFGTPLGSTDPNNAGSTQYNQVINGGKYYIQTEFSNSAFARLGVGNGCQPSAKASAAAKPATSTNQVIIISQAYPSSLANNGKATSDVQVLVSDRQNFGIQGDTVTFSSYVVQGNGSCGTLNKTSGKTDEYGSLDVTYKASTDNVICGIVATDGKGGKSSTSVVYQGSFRGLAPTASDTFPTTLRAGATSYFTVTFGNRTGRPIPYGTIDLQIFPGTNKSPNVTAKQITLATSIRGRSGPFSPLKLYGSTVKEGAIQGNFVGPSGVGLTIKPHSKATVTFRVTLAASVPGRGKTPVLSFEAYLDQLNPATGTGSTLADTEATDVAVTH